MCSSDLMTNLLESLKRKVEDLDWSWIEYEDGDVYLSKYVAVCSIKRIATFLWKNKQLCDNI